MNLGFYTIHWVDWWTVLLGLGFVLVTLFAPKGLGGLVGGGDLAGGQQQQLAIGRALVTRPKLLLLDEPTEGIEPNIIQQIGRVIQYLRDQGQMAILLVEQYFDFACDAGDRFYVLDRGSVSFERQKADLSGEDLAAAFRV